MDRSQIQHLPCPFYLVYLFFGLITVPTIYTQDAKPQYFRVPAPYLPPNGLHNWTTQAYALQGATLIRKAGDTIHNSLLLIKDGRIIYAGPNNRQIPPEYIVISVQGKWIYPAFIDLFSECGLRPPPPPKQKKSGPQLYSRFQTPLAANEAIHAYRHATEYFQPTSQCFTSYLNGGFALILSHVRDGILRGTGVLFFPIAGKHAGELIWSETPAQFASFRKGRSRQDYPTSLMGAIALLRQTLYDAQWYHQTRKHFPDQIPYDASLEALSYYWLEQHLPWFIEITSPEDLWPISRLAREFQIPWIVLATGGEYQVLPFLRRHPIRLVIPLNFPEPLREAADPYFAQLIPWRVLKHWEMAPAQPALLAQTDELSDQFALTMWKLTPKKWWQNLRKAIRYGLPAEHALSALTEIPAQWLGIFQWIGTLEPGKIASFFVASSDIFQDKNACILQMWVRGELVLGPLHPIELRGKYQLVIQQDTATLEVIGTCQKPIFKIYWRDGTSWSVRAYRENQYIRLNFTIYEDTDSAQTYTLTGWIQNDSLWQGTSWYATRIEPYRPSPDTTPVPHFTPADIPRPFSPWGWKPNQIPKPKTYLLKDATIWTLDSSRPILPEGDILITNGKIQAVAKEITPPSDAIVLNLKGMHITPGIVDEHSHIAIRGGVNEAGWAITAEVRIADVLRAHDVNLYRQLAGGVTTIHLLHGSANPIGGQTIVIKNRWGAFYDSLIEWRAPPFIKFALGENVKQSNWGDRYRIRFPQTRVGVEQIIEDAFRQAKTYHTIWQQYQALPKREKRKIPPPRRFLRWDALAEILEGKRFITCHSYVQSEIAMLVHLARRLHFRVNTFTHGLEAYKVADLLHQEGTAVSTFSDWWAYKYEVIEAIPHNAALCTKAGVLTGINSDDAEMARRLNQEASKTILYGELDSISALRLITLNPAKMLHLDQWVGTITPGKDADLVVWTHSPLSVTARVQYTFVEGRLLYSYDAMQQRARQLQKERTRLIKAMQERIKAGEATSSLKETPQWLQDAWETTYRCDP